MKEKFLRLVLLLSLALLLSSCGTSPQPTPTNTPPPPTVAPTNIPEPFAASKCHPSTEYVEVNKRLPKGVGPGYSFPPDRCSTYCFWVDQGSQLKIGVTDLFSDLNLSVAIDFFTSWDSNSSWDSDNPGNQDEIVKITNPDGYYYVRVCGDNLMGYMSRGETTIIETDAARFTLYSEFTP